MATWLNSFLLGRPGYEIAFDLNPNTVQVETAQISAKNRVLSGKLKKWVLRTEFPTIRMDGRFFTTAQKDQMESLLAITDTMLSFKVRDTGFTRYAEKHSPDSSVSVTLQENSATLLSAALVAAGFSASVAITGVYTNPGGTGTNYYTGGSYDSATRVITLGASLPSTDPVYVTYTYTGWLVNMDRLGWQANGGWLDVTGYSGWILEGV